MARDAVVDLKCIICICKSFKAFLFVKMSDDRMFQTYVLKVKRTLP